MHEVLQKFFSPHAFRVALPDVWTGFQLNLKLMVVAEILVLVLALAIAVVRGLPGRGSAPSAAICPASCASVRSSFRPTRCASTCRRRHGVVPTPPAAMRASCTLSPSCCNAAATETSAHSKLARSRTFR